MRAESKGGWSLADVRMAWFTTGKSYVREGKAAFVELISVPSGSTECQITVIVTPLAPPADAPPLEMLGAQAAIAFAQESPSPRLRAVAEAALANLAAPPVEDLSKLKLELWLESSEGWSKIESKSIDARDEVQFSGVPTGRRAWIELMRPIPAAETAWSPAEEFSIAAMSLDERLVANMQTMPVAIAVGTDGIRGLAPVRTLKKIIPPHLDEVEVELAFDKAGCPCVIFRSEASWIAQAELCFAVGPVRGAVLMRPAGRAWAGACLLKNLRPDQFESLSPRLSLMVSPENQRIIARPQSVSHEKSPVPIWQIVRAWFLGGRVVWLRPAVSAAAFCSILFLIVLANPTTMVTSRFPELSQNVRSKGSESSIRTNAATVAVPVSHFLAAPFELKLDFRNGRIEFHYPERTIYAGLLLEALPERGDDPSEFFHFKAEGKRHGQSVCIDGWLGIRQNYDVARLGTNRVAGKISLEYIAIDADAVVVGESTNLFLRTVYMPRK